MDFTTGVAIFKRFVLCREFQDRQILFGSISFPFYVDFVIETKGVGVMVCSCLSWLEPFFSFRVTSLFILWYCYALLTLKLFSCQNSTCSCYVFPRAFWSIHRHTRQNIHWFKSKPFGCVEPVCVCSPTMEARASTIEKHGSNSLISVMRRKTNCSMETLRRPQTRHYDSGRHFAPLLHLPYKNPKWGRTKGEWYTHLVYSPPLNIFFEIYQITAHKIQIFDKSDQAVEQRFVPLLPAGGTDDDDNGKAKDTEDLLTTFNTKKKENGHRLRNSYSTFICSAFNCISTNKKSEKKATTQSGHHKKGTTTSLKVASSAASRGAILLLLLRSQALYMYYRNEIRLSVMS